MSSLEWNKEPHKPGLWVRRNLIIIDDSIWYSSPHISYKAGAGNGMTEYSIKSHKIMKINDCFWCE